MRFCSSMLDVIEFQIEFINVLLCAAIFRSIVGEDVFDIQILRAIERQDFVVQGCCRMGRDFSCMYIGKSQ